MAQDPLSTSHKSIQCLADWDSPFSHCEQSHTVRSCNPFHCPCDLAYNHDASSQGHHNGLCSLLSRCHSQLRRIGFDLKPCESGYLAVAVEGQRGRQAGHVRRRYMAQAVSKYVLARGRNYQLLRLREWCGVVRSEEEAEITCCRISQKWIIM